MSSAIDILLIGHMTVDLLPAGRMLGGTISYAAPTYAAFGRRVGVVTSAAADEPLLSQLSSFGKLSVLPSQDSLTYENVYDDRGRQQYVRATAQPLSFADIPPDWTDAPYVHLGPLAAEINPREMSRRLSKSTIMITLQGMMRRWNKHGLVKFRRWFDQPALERIDIVIYSEEDVSEHPQLTNEMRRVCKHLVVTNGRNGGAYYHDGGAMRYDSIPVAPHDLTGAGDVFAASLLGALPMVNDDVASAVKLAGRLAAYSVTRSGIDSAPTPAEIERELERISRDK